MKIEELGKHVKKIGKGVLTGGKCRVCKEGDEMRIEIMFKNDDIWSAYHICTNPECLFFEKLIDPSDCKACIRQIEEIFEKTAQEGAKIFGDVIQIFGGMI